ncbi:raffinose/stachyose/melibiose transport system substrate-binding protein [Paenibacillus sophorae]|uniref:Extracellular solute-binding protein n=2 Tax=Paenibacillus sophorae TaxID=1333845 RepID=A0A1H8VHL0_9BACL|nr:extracellular solute-binding protein [Paenibacillus sophorae]SEP14783.1 raffinose/stachyose/melibiose transport system substrate-binding protein [Paenibacillus sophorae]
MQTMKNRFSIILMACLLILSLAACGSNSTPKNENASSEVGPVTLSIAMHVANVKEQEPYMYGIIQKFQEKYPDIKIDLTGAETQEHVKKMKMMSQSGNLPDIFWMLPAPAKEMNQAGLLLDLSDFLKSNPEITAGIDSQMVSDYQDGGKQFGLPYQALVTGLWYNKALFDQYKVKVPETYEELLAAAKVFKANNVVTIAKGSKDTFSTWAFLGMLTRYGFFDKIADIESGKEKFNNPDFLKLFNKIDELRVNGAFPENVSTLSYFQAVEMFTGGKAAMLDAGVWETKKIEGSPIAKTAGFSWGPTFSDGVGNQKIAMAVAAAPLVASAKVKDDPAKYDAVQKFFAFFYSQEGAAVMAENEAPPVVKYTGTVDKEKYPVYAEVINKLNEPGWERPRAQPDLVVSEAVGNQLNDSIYGVINGIYKPEQALDLIDQKMAK